MRFNFRKHVAKIFFILATVLLFASFRYNAFSAADDRWFEVHQDDSESLVMGRLANARANGVMTDAGRLGRLFVPDPRINLGYNQYTLYEQDRVEGSWVPYQSQLGGQGTLFVAIDALFDWFDIEPVEDRLDTFRSLTSLASAGTIALLLTLLGIQLGWTAAGVALLSTCTSAWIVVFGDNLYWVIWTFYLPTLAVFWFLHREERSGVYPAAIAPITVGCLTALKCSAGYEFLSALMIATVSPLAYFTIKNKWPFRRLVRRTLFLGVAAVAGFLVTQIVHVIQESVANDVGFLQAFQKRLHHAHTRTHVKAGVLTQPNWVPGVEATITQVLSQYWNGVAFNLEPTLGFSHFKMIHYEDLIFFFLVFSTWGFASSDFVRKIAKNRRTVLGMVAATWFSALGPLSWFVLAKVHSAVHLHMNFILFHLSFSIYGFALVGLVCSLMLSSWFSPRTKVAKNGATND